MTEGVAEEKKPFESALDRYNREHPGEAASPLAVAPSASAPAQAWTPPTAWTERWHELVLDIIDPQRKASATDIALFFYRCRQLNLDPLAKQAHLLWLAGRPQLYIGIHGARAIAERTGQRGDEFVSAVQKEGDKVVSVTVTVERVRWTGDRYYKASYTGTARIGEYRPKREFKPGDPWVEKPELMLEKCAAMLALRKGFPEVLSDVYVREELEVAAEGNGGHR